ncbi:MAG: family 78 glycoside hydrolase catalytic domain [Kiritimatiellae bacterium]|nr:family 78 glycoside hydrolase catalytic domain [Kiritimatiellia bacterium]
MQKKWTPTPTRSRKWHAQWIWTDRNPPEPNTYGYFRKTFDLAAVPERCVLFVTADSRYQLFLNGVFVGRGAPQSQPFFQYYDEYDATACLAAGTNCMAAVVYHVGNLPDTRGGLLAELAGGRGERIIGTDATWRATRAVAWEPDTYYFRMNKVNPYQEFFDARKEPAGWREAGFDDGEWGRAASLGVGGGGGRGSGPWSRLVPRDIPRMRYTAVNPERIARVEECLDIENRPRRNDLAPGLSMVGKPITYSRLKQAEGLCGGTGPMLVQGSQNHLDRDFDGRYDPCVVLDFGRVITARARLSLQGAAGGQVDIGYAERLIDDQFNIDLEGAFADRYTMKDGEQVFESFAWKAFRYMKLRFRNCDRPVRVDSVQAVTSTYPYEERGAFASADATLNRIFEISRYTLRLCSNDALMDTPWREQAQWLGDVALVTVPAVHSCFGDTALPRKFFLQAGQNQHQTGMISNMSNTVNHEWRGAIPDYSLWWVRGLWEQFLYTGDEELVHRLYPQALRVLDAHIDYLNNELLIENMPYWVFIDWAAVDTHGVCGPYNAIFYGVLESLVKLAEFRGDTHTAGYARELRAGIKASFHRVLFDSARGCYADARVNDALSGKISEHGNLTPIWAGLCDDAVARQIVGAVFGSERSQTFTEAQPFYMAVVLPALERAGRFELALDLIRRRWGRRMVDKGATSVFEEWYQNGSWRSGRFHGFLRTHSHAWSAFPADFLIRHLMGLEILEPGCGRLRVAPKKTDFDYMAAFPTPLGTVSAEWKAGEMTVSADDGIQLEFGE